MAGSAKRSSSGSNLLARAVLKRAAIVFGQVVLAKAASVFINSRLLNWWLKDSRNAGGRATGFQEIGGDDRSGVSGVKRPAHAPGEPARRFSWPAGIEADGQNVGGSWAFP